MNENTDKACKFLDSLVTNNRLLTAVLAEDIDLFPKDLIPPVKRDGNSHGVVDLNELEDTIAKHKAAITRHQSEIQKMHMESDEYSPEDISNAMNNFNSLSTDIIQQLAEFNKIYSLEIEPWIQGSAWKTESADEGLGPAVFALHEKYKKLRNALRDIDTIRTSHGTISSLLLQGSSTDQRTRGSLPALTKGGWRLGPVNELGQNAQNALMRLDKMESILRDALKRRRALSGEYGTL